MNQIEADAAGFLSEVELALEETLAPEAPAERAEADTPPAMLLAAARHLCLGGGKRARSRLVLSFGAIAGAPPAALLDVAVAAELMHAASLLHDDVIDEGALRRGRPTVNALWGNTVAVLAGDLLLSSAFTRLARRTPHLMPHAARVVLAMTRAAMREVAGRGRLDHDLAWWRGMAEGKTGELFGWCGRAAAIVAGDRRAAERFAAAGLHLGVAFQLADDLADLCADDTGKSPFADVRARSPSYPILVACDADAEVRAALADAWRREGAIASELAEGLGAAVVRSGAATRARREITLELAAARAALGPYGARAATGRLFAWAETLRRQAERSATEERPCVAT